MWAPDSGPNLGILVKPVVQLPLAVIPQVFQNQTYDTDALDLRQSFFDFQFKRTTPSR